MLGAVILSACGSGGGGPSASPGSVNPTTLTIVEWTNPPAITATKHINQLFEKQHPGVTVKVVSAPTNDTGWTSLQNTVLASKQVDLLAQFAPTVSGFPPAYTHLQPSGTAALVASHQLTNLADQPFMKRFDRNLQEFAIGYQGGIYGAMAAEYNGAGSIWYKPDLLKKYNLSVPRTFNEFTHDLSVFKSHGLNPLFVAGKDNLQLIAWRGILYQLEMQGHAPADATAVGAQLATSFWQGKENWDSQIFQQTTTRYQQVMQYVTPGAAGVSEFAAPGIWSAQSEDYPFFIDGSWDGDTIHQANPNLKFGFFTLPGTDDPNANRIPIQPDLTWTVPIWAPHQKVALEWLDFFSQPDNYRYWLGETGSMSTETGISSAKNSWMSWLNAHQSTAFPNVPLPYTPNGAPTEAGGPDLTKMVPFGSVSPQAELSAAAHAYSASRPQG